MGYELIVFTIVSIVILLSGLLGVFHVKPKEMSDKRRTTYGLISLTLGAWAFLTVLRMGGII